LCCLFFFIQILITSLWYLQTLLHVSYLPYILHMKTTVVTFIFLSINLILNKLESCINWTLNKPESCINLTLHCKKSLLR
jgi:hypothetical protein